MTREEFIQMEAQKYEAQLGHAEALLIAERTLAEEMSKANPLDRVIIEELGRCPQCFYSEWLLKEADGIITCLNCHVEIIPIENDNEW